MRRARLPISTRRCSRHVRAHSARTATSPPTSASTAASVTINCPPTDVCDKQAFVCRRVCQDDKGCPPHVACQPLKTTGLWVCLGCAAEFGDCNGDPSDGCETDLTTDDNCGGCGLPPTKSCRIDNDHDGYPNPNGKEHVACACPWSDTPDCDDNDPNAHPHQDAPQRGSSNGGDYDCDGNVEVIYNYGTVCGGTCTHSIWVGTQPDCGETGQIVQCVKDAKLGCIPGSSAGTFTQLCI